MPKIHVKGTIVSDNLQRIYDWIGLDATSPSSVTAQLPSDGSKEVDVIINSGGGDVFAGSEIYTILKEYSGDVTVKVVGIAASAASVIAMAADKLLISPTAQMMIHNVSTSSGGGDYRDFEHTAEVLRSANQSIANAYKARTGKSDDELKDLMDKETWFNANDAVEQGFADEIMFAEKEQQLALSANFGSPQLSSDAIDKIISIMDGSKEDAPDTKLAEAQFRLLNLKGVLLT